MIICGLGQFIALVALSSINAVRSQLLYFMRHPLPFDGPYCNPAICHPGVWTVCKSLPTALMLEYQRRPVYAINLSLACVVTGFMITPNPMHRDEYRTKGVSAKLISCEHLRAASAISMAYRAAAGADEEELLHAQMSDAVIDFQSRRITKNERGCIILNIS